MKKILVLLLVSIMAVSFVTGCSKKAEPVKTGLAVINSLSKSAAATADAEGLAEADSTIVAVMVGADGKIVDCKIDAVQSKINFTTEGKLTTDLTTTFDSKQVLKEQYGMKSQSGIGKEWFEEANAFADYVVGKTVDEVKGIAVSDQGTAADADLSASVTVHIGDFINGVVKAVANAQDLGAAEGDKLGIGVNSDISKSKEATADAAGLAEADFYYAATTFNADGKITSCVIDATNGKVNFDTTGAITTDLTVAPQTKQELKEAYGMKSSSSIGKEWYEEANAFADYVKGKTAAEVKGLALTDAGLASDADLAASVTVHVGPFMAIVDKANTNAAE